MNFKSIITEHLNILKKIGGKVKDKKNITKREKIILHEMDRLNKMYSGEGDIGPYVYIESFRKTLSITKQTLSDWKKKGFPESQDMALFVPDVFIWLRQQWVDIRDDKKGKDKIDVMHNIDIRRKKADAILSEIKIAEAEERLVDRESMLRSMHEHISTCSKMIQDLEKKLARHVPRKYRKGFIQDGGEEIVDILNALADLGEE